MAFPIASYREKLLAAGSLTEPGVDAIQKRVNETIDNAFLFAGERARVDFEGEDPSDIGHIEAGLHSALAAADGDGGGKISCF